jgi:hypothetical protein
MQIWAGFLFVVIPNADSNLDYYFKRMQICIRLDFYLDAVLDLDLDASFLMIDAHPDRIFI